MAKLVIMVLVMGYSAVSAANQTCFDVKAPRTGLIEVSDSFSLLNEGSVLCLTEDEVVRRKGTHFYSGNFQVTIEGETGTVAHSFRAKSVTFSIDTINSLYAATPSDLIRDDSLKARFVFYKKSKGRGVLLGHVSVDGNVFDLYGR